MDVDELARQTGSEANVIENIRRGLEVRGWKRVDLCQRMDRAAAQDPSIATIHPTTLSKLLSGANDRHISIAQLVCLARVFEVSISALLVEPDTAAGPLVWSEFDALASARNDMRDAQEAYDNHLRRLRVLLERHPLAASSIRQRARRVAESNEAELRGMATNDAQPLSGLADAFGLGAQA